MYIVTFEAGVCSCSAHSFLLALPSWLQSPSSSELSASLDGEYSCLSCSSVVGRPWTSILLALKTDERGNAIYDNNKHVIQLWSCDIL